MRWTAERPTIAGYYWYRSNFSLIRGEVNMVAFHVNYDGEGSSCFTQLGPMALYDQKYESLEGEFYGPIQPPPEED